MLMIVWGRGGTLGLYALELMDKEKKRIRNSTLLKAIPDNPGTQSQAGFNGIKNPV